MSEDAHDLNNETPTFATTVKRGDYTLTDEQIDCLANEFCGKVLSDALDGPSSDEISVEFLSVSIRRQFLRALTCFRRRKGQ